MEDWLGVPVEVLVWLCVGDGQGSAIRVRLDAAPNCVRHETERETVKEAPALRRGHVVFAEPPKAAIGDCTVVQRLPLSQT